MGTHDTINFFLVFLTTQTLAAPSQPITKEISFPYFENEFNLPDNSFDLDFKGFKGHLNIANTKVKGLDTLSVKFNIDPSTSLTSSSIKSESDLGVSGDYELFLEGKTPNGFSLKFIGNGSHNNWIRNFSIGHQAQLTDGDSGYAEISNLQLQIIFQKIHLELFNLSINDFSLNWIWKSLNGFLNESFQDLWQEISLPVAEVVSRRLNSFFTEQKLTVKDLVDIFETDD